MLTSIRIISYYACSAFSVLIIRAYGGIGVKKHMRRVTNIMTTVCPLELHSKALQCCVSFSLSTRLLRLHVPYIHDGRLHPYMYACIDYLDYIPGIGNGIT